MTDSLPAWEQNNEPGVPLTAGVFFGPSRERRENECNGYLYPPLPHEVHMPIANIQILKGHSKAERHILIARVTDAIVTPLGVEASSVRVVLTEIDPENWAYPRHQLSN